MGPDFRSEKSESAEGKGFARRAWESYSRTVNKATQTLVEQAAGQVAATQVTDMAGFWLVWHLEGGFEGLEKLGMNRATIFRKIKRFRTVFKQHPDEFRFAGVSIDHKVYREAVQAEMAARAAKKSAR